jgi:PTH1 family peptidyl-tRNA hydrolase
VHLVVGLGNPGRDCEKNRHNVGFMVVDALAHAHGFSDGRAKYGGLFSRGILADRDVALLKPSTFMNLSGESVQAAAAWLKVAPREIIVVHDELDLPWKTVRLKLGGGHAGHNGLRSVIQCLGSAEFVRLRVGIGRPPASFLGEVSDWVLSNFDMGETADLGGVVDIAKETVVQVLRGGFEAATAQLHGLGAAKRPDEPTGREREK